MDVSDLVDLQAYVTEKLVGKLDATEIAFEELNLTTTPANISSVLKFLRDDVQTQFVSIIDICGVDYPEREQRFALLRSDRARLHRIGPAKSQSARGLAEDYARLANEILEAFTAPEFVIVDTDDSPYEDTPIDERSIERSW